MILAFLSLYNLDFNDSHQVKIVAVGCALGVKRKKFQSSLTVLRTAQLDADFFDGQLLADAQRRRHRLLHGQVLRLRLDPRQFLQGLGG